MIFADFVGSMLLALLLAVVFGVLLRGRNPRGQGRVDAVLLLAAAVLIALVVILWLLVAKQ